MCCFMSEELPLILVKSVDVLQGRCAFGFCRTAVHINTDGVFFIPDCCCLVKATANVPHKDFYCVYSRFIVSEGKPNMHHVGVTFFLLSSELLQLEFCFAYLSSFLLFLLSP